MTDKEQEQIKAMAHYRLTKAEQKVAAHAKVISEIRKELERATEFLQELSSLRVVRVNDKNLLASGGEEINYRSLEELVSEFKEYKEAIQLRNAAQKECHDLGA